MMTPPVPIGPNIEPYIQLNYKDLVFCLVSQKCFTRALHLTFINH